MAKTALRHYVKRISIAITSVMFVLLTFAAPASATTVDGTWWTNHSTCHNYYGLVTVDTQGRYYNYTLNNGEKRTQFTGAAVSSGYSGVNLTRFKWELMAVGPNGIPYVWDSYDLYLGSGISLPTGAFVPGKQSYTIPQNLHPYVVYHSWLSNGAFCQGQWNIGQ